MSEDAHTFDDRVADIAGTLSLGEAVSLRQQRLEDLGLTPAVTRSLERISFDPTKIDPTAFQERTVVFGLGPECRAAIREEVCSRVPYDPEDLRFAVPMSDSKPTNPKDMIGSSKLPMHLWPESATVLGCLALLDGALKYGRTNWRVAGVKASIYYDAQRRHMDKWFEGEDTDPDSGLPHLAHALACIAILADSQAAGKLVDDRMVEGGYLELVKAMTPHVERLKKLHAGRTVRHYTIEDN